MATTVDKLQSLLDKLAQYSGSPPKPSGDGYMCRCPCHDDRKASLSVTVKDTKILVTCHAGCETLAIMQTIGLPMSDLFLDSNGGPVRDSDEEKGWLWEEQGLLAATYIYQNGCEKLRSKNKDFRWRVKDNSKKYGYSWTLGKEPNKIEPGLYRQQKVIAGVAAGGRVHIIEGEKDVHTIERLGWVGTTSPHGGGGKSASKKWKVEYNEHFRDADVAVLCDHDLQGKEHAANVAKNLHGIAAAVRVIDLPGLEVKEDISDWVAKGGTREQLQQLIEAAPEWTPPKKEQVNKGTDRAVTLEEIKATQLTELKTARRLEAREGESLKHSCSLGWLKWSGVKWERSIKPAERDAHSLGQTIREEAHQQQDPDVARAYFRHAKAVESSRGIDATLSIAKSLIKIDGDAIEWDAAHHLLTVPNGVIDLREGKLLPHKRERFLTKMSRIEFDPTAKCPRFLKFLDEIFAGDEELITYLEWAFGYALSGWTHCHLFFLLVGEGRNGKSTLLNTLQFVLGPEFAMQLDPETLLLQRYSSHPCNIAALHGARLVCASETNPGRRLNESLIKVLVGGDRLRARHIRMDEFEFRPVLKLMLGTNHRPRVRDNSSAMWERIRLLPFTEKFTGKRCDERLGEKLRGESKGILAWGVRGAQRAAKGEDKVPQRVRAATAEYRDSENVFGQFVKDQCEVGPFNTCKAKPFYDAFVESNTGEWVSMKEFKQYMLGIDGVSHIKSDGIMTYKGITLSIREDREPAPYIPTEK